MSEARRSEDEIGISQGNHVFFIQWDADMSITQVKRVLKRRRSISGVDQTPYLIINPVAGFSSSGAHSIEIVPTCLFLSISSLLASVHYLHS